MKTHPYWHPVLFLVILLSPLMLVTNGACQDETPSIELSRYKAIAMAIRNNIDLRVRALDSALAETEIQASESIYDPQLSAGASFAQTRVAGETYGTETVSGVVSVSQKVSTGGTVALSAWTSPTSAYSDPLYDYTDWASAIGITIYQPLLKNGGKEATELGITQDKLAHAGTLESFRSQVMETVFSVISEYNRLYVQRQLLELREEALHSAQQLLKEIKSSPKPGAKQKIEIANTEYALSQRQTEYIEAARSVSSREARLLYLIGIEKRSHIIPVDPPSPQEPSETEEQAITLALEHHPDLKKLQIQLESSALRERVSKRNLLPDLSLSAGGGFRGYAEDGTFPDTVSQMGDGKGSYWSAGVRVSFPLGNDLAESEHRRNTLRTEQLRNQLNATEWKIRDAIQDDNRSLISRRLQMKETAKSRLLAEQRVAQYRESRRLGESTVKDLLDAENDLIYARDLELKAIDDFAYLVARLWKDIGVLLERQNIRIDTNNPAQLTAGELPLTPPNDKAATAVAKALIRPMVVPSESLAETASLGKNLAPAALTSPPIGAKSDKEMKPVINNAPATATTERVSGNTFYTLKIGEYLESEVSSIMRKITRGGLVPVVIDGRKQEREVYRLLVGDFKDRASAEQALEPLAKSHSNGFVLKNAEHRFNAYAGSFFTRQGAEAEQKRLARLGMTLRLKKVAVRLPTVLLTAGSFTTREAAREGAQRLEQQGLAVEILQS